MRRAFISSTSKDLIPYRKAANETCISLGIHPVAMEFFPAMAAGAVAGSKKKIDESDFYIGIFGFRYGYIADGETKSVTEIEFDYAASKGHDQLCFLVHPELEVDWPDKDPENTAKLKAFRDRINSSLIRAEFKNVDQFARQLMHALVDGGYNESEPLTYATYRAEPFPPEGELPDPLHLPPDSRMTHSRNPLFVGREKDLLTIAENLRHGEGVVGIVAAAAVGIGGLGKTQLAVEFCYRYGRFFQGVNWLQLPVSPSFMGEMSEGQRGTEAIDSDSHIKAEIAACGRAMGLDTPEQDALVEMTLRAWQQYGPRLVILDNVENEQVVRDWLPRLGDNVRVLLTSRRQQWSRALNINTHRLDVLSPEESRQLLRDLAPHLNDFPDGELDEIGKKFGYLPLALDLAGRYMGDEVRAGITPAEYLARLAKKANMLDHDSLIGAEDEASPTNHILNLNATFALSWEQLDDEKDALARSAFLCAGYCAPNSPIPGELLQGAAGDDVDEEDFEAALKRLHQTGLLQIEDRDITIHPLLAEYAQKVDGGERLEAVVDVIALMAYDANTTGLPANFTPLRLHVEQLALRSEGTELERTSTLWNNLGYHLDMISDYHGARVAYERSLDIAQAVFGTDSTEVANRVNNLGMVLQALGNCTEAKSSFERVIKILPEGHQNYGTAINNLGTVLEAQGDFKGAKEAFQRALHIDEIFFGPDHPNVARDVNNLGNVLQLLGDFTGAKEAFQRALHIDEMFFGPDHPNVARDVNNLGNVLRLLDDFAGAKEAFERALLIGEAVYGSNHPQVARYINNLGTVLEAQGDYTGAKEALARALRILEQHLGENHPSVATLYNNLGNILQLLGDHIGAKEALARALRIDEATFGSDHPNVARDVNNLGIVLADMGDLDKGIHYLEHALRIFLDLMPEDHPDIQKTWNTIVYYRIQKIMRDEGVSQEEAVEILKRQLGGE